MQFAVISRALDSGNVPAQVAVSLAKQTFQMLSSNPDPRIKAVYPFAGERAAILIVDVKSGEELQELMSSLPLSGISKSEIHPIGSVQSSLKSIEDAERRIAAMSPAAAVR
jgi:muconolactone delta-isomerase